MEFKVHTFSSIIMIFTMFLIISSNYTKNKQLIADKKQENITILVTLLICTVTIVYAIYSGSKDNNIKLNYGLLFLIAIFCIASIGYTIYEWDTIKKNSTCNAIIPTSTHFKSSDYYVYRIIYLITLIVLVVILQYKINDSNFSSRFSKPTLHKLLFLIPFLLPIFTEIISWITNKIAHDPVTNPESLLLNFIKGKGKGEWGKQWTRSIMPFGFYIILMGLAIASSMNKIGTDGGKTAIYLIIFFLIFFSFIMRNLFVQDCSLKENIDVSNKKSEITQQWACALEKYGGIQSMLNVSLIIIVIYHVDKPSYKLLFFIIICLASWGLSTTYILNF